ncbi:hypothetical protein TBS_25540 [Thermobispora bispora]
MRGAATSGWALIASRSAAPYGTAVPITRRHAGREPHRAPRAGTPDRPAGGSPRTPDRPAGGSPRTPANGRDDDPTPGDALTGHLRDGGAWRAGPGRAPPART